MGHARHDAVIGADLQQFQCGVKNIVSICHLFAAHHSLTGEVSGRRDEFIDHRVSSSSAIIFVRHLFARPMFEPIRCPRFTLGNVEFQAAFERKEAASVSLRPRLHALLPAPLQVCFGKSLPQQLSFGQFEIEPHAIQDVCKPGCFLRPICIIHDRPQPSDLEQDKRKVRHQIVATTLPKSFRQIVSPVTSFQLHRITEERTQMF